MLSFKDISDAQSILPTCIKLKVFQVANMSDKELLELATNPAVMIEKDSSGDRLLLWLNIKDIGSYQFTFRNLKLGMTLTCVKKLGFVHGAAGWVKV